jgi:8-oxo-dGTP pyrophosphatase MutT (NUDIX family)
MSAQGLLYAENGYDRSRYASIQDLSMEMQALAAGETLADLEPLRLPVLSRPTPVTCTDAAVIDAAGRILLILRSDTGDWAMPGGALEVGESPAEGAAREVLEETGFRCRPIALVGVFDSYRCGAVSRFQLHITQFLCVPLPDAPRPSSTPNEVLDMGWFPEDALPANLHIGHALRIRESYRVWSGDMRPYFDRSELYSNSRPSTSGAL